MLGVSPPRCGSGGPESQGHHAHPRPTDALVPHGSSVASAPVGFFAPGCVPCSGRRNQLPASCTGRRGHRRRSGFSLRDIPRKPLIFAIWMAPSWLHGYKIPCRRMTAKLKLQCADTGILLKKYKCRNEASLYCLCPSECSVKFHLSFFLTNHIQTELDHVTVGRCGKRPCESDL
jgi:hypothetical protein